MADRELGAATIRALSLMSRREVSKSARCLEQEGDQSPDAKALAKPPQREERRLWVHLFV